MYYSKIIFCLLSGFFVSLWFAPDFKMPAIFAFLLPPLLISCAFVSLRVKVFCLTLFFVIFANLLFQMQKPVSAGTVTDNYIVQNIFQLKGYLLRQINKSLPQPHSGLLSGLLFGGSGRLSKIWAAKFRDVGVSHIMAVSGFNVMIVVNGVMALLAPLYFSRKKIFFILSGFLILFILMTGFEASIFRAVLMAWIVLCAKTFGRYLNVRNLLLFAGFVMVLVSPRVLRYDIGFQLSFAATGGLMFVSPWLARVLMLEKISQPWLQKALIEYILPSIVAYFCTFPLIFIYFGKISLVAPLVNVLIAPLVPLAMALGGLLLLIGWLPGISWLVVGANWLALSIIFKIVNLFS